MGRLHEYFLNNNGRVIYKWSHYFDIYERHFARFVGKQPTFLEIGVGEGGALAMWKDYFGPGAKIIGLDVREDRAFLSDTATQMYIGSQDDPKILQRIVDEFGPLDIVLDDGSHIMKHMIATFEYLYPRSSMTGVYMIEDVSCSYQSRFDGGYKRDGTIVEYTKDLIDRLHLIHARDEQAPKPDAFTLSTDSMHIYDGIIAFEKRPKPQPQSMMTGVYPTLGRKAVMPSTISVVSKHIPPQETTNDRDN